MNTVLYPATAVAWCVGVLIRAFTGPQNLKGWLISLAIIPTAAVIGICVGKALERKARREAKA